MTGTTIVLSRVPLSGTPIDSWYGDLPGNLILLTSDQAATAYQRVLSDVRAFTDYDTSPQVVSELRDICGSRPVSRLVHATEGDLLPGSQDPGRVRHPRAIAAGHLALPRQGDDETPGSGGRAGGTGLRCA